MTYNKSKIMKKAWELFKAGAETFSKALKSAWAWIKAQMEKIPSTIEEKVSEYREIKMMIEELEARAAEIKESIIEDMEEAGTDELSVDVFKVRYITVISKRFDASEFKKNQAELYSQYLKENVCKRFSVA